MHTIELFYYKYVNSVHFLYSSPDATRTHTQFLATDFESVLSTNSNTEPFIGICEILWSLRDSNSRPTH